MIDLSKIVDSFLTILERLLLDRPDADECGEEEVFVDEMRLIDAYCSRVKTKIEPSRSLSVGGPK